MNNLAYEKAFDIEHEKTRLEMRPKMRPKVRKKTRRKTMKIKGMVVVSIIMSAFIVFGYAKITQVTDQKAKLQRDIMKLENEQVSLNARNSANLSLSSVEEYVINNFNMNKISKHQIEYVELSNPDVIMGKNSEIKQNVGKVINAISDTITGFLAYIT